MMMTWTEEQWRLQHIQPIVVLPSNSNCMDHTLSSCLITYLSCRLYINMMMKTTLCLVAVVSTASAFVPAAKQSFGWVCVIVDQRFISMWSSLARSGSVFASIVVGAKLIAMYSSRQIWLLLYTWCSIRTRFLYCSPLSFAFVQNVPRW